MKKIFFSFAVLILTLAALTGCGDKTGDRDGVTKVKYDSETGKVSITATLTSDTYKDYKKDTLYLMEIPAGQTIADVSTSVPAAQMKAKGTMEQSLDLKSGARTLLYSGFVLAYYDYASGYTPIGDVRYVENPDALATSDLTYPEYPSIKGLFVTSAAEAVQTGTNHTVIRVPIEKFISAKGDSDTLATVFCGNSYYINREQIAKLDHKVKTMSEAGIEVMLQFTLDTDPYALDSGVGKLASLYTAGATAPEGENEHYALAVNDPDGFEKLASFFEYIASRYTREDGEYGFAGAFIIGDRVNDLEKANVDNPRTLAEATEGYARLFRIAYTALRSNYSNGKIFLSVSSFWAEAEADQPDENTEQTGEMPVAKRRLFGAKEFLSNFAARLIRGGDIPYSVCLFLEHDGDSDVSNDLTGGGSEAEKIGCSNLHVFKDFLGGTGLTYKDECREIAIVASLPAEDEELMAQSYAKLYFACADNGVSAFIYNGERDGETGNGETGLMTSAQAGHRPEKRKIHEIYCDIDRADGAETLSKLSAALGERAESYAEENGTVLYLTGESLVGQEKKEKRTEKSVLFTFDGTNAAGFYPAYSALSAEPCGDGENGGIYAVLSPLGPGDLMGVRSPVLSGELFKRGRTIRLTLTLETPSSNTGKVTLFLTNGDSDGKVSYVSSATVQAGNKQTVSFDVSDFADEMDENDEVRLSVWCEADNNAPLRSENAENSGYSLQLNGVELYSKKPVSPLVWIIPLVIVLLAGGFFFATRGLPALSEAMENYRRNTAAEKAMKQRDARSNGRGAPPPRPSQRQAPRPMPRTPATQISSDQRRQPPSNRG